MKHTQPLGCEQTDAMADPHAALNSLASGMSIVFGGNRVALVSQELAAAFQPGDRLIVVQSTGDLLHVSADDQSLVDDAVLAAHAAFAELNRVGDDQITAFYDHFARRLEDEATFAPVRAANDADVERARAAGRSTTRLQLSDSMRAGMIAGLRSWRDTPPLRGQVVESVEHDGWRVEQRKAGLGVIGFVFEGRPNVFADAAGVLRSGNAVVFRIGRDALGTARAIVEHALRPALSAAGVPEGCVQLLDTPSRAGGWALFSNPLVALAVARGSGQAVEQLGAVARQAGIPVSLHGTGGGWLVTGEAVDPAVFTSTVEHSLDRKVCNTLNVCCILRSHAETLVPQFLKAIEKAGGQRSATTKLHVQLRAKAFVPDDWFERTVTIQRAEGGVTEKQAELLAPDMLGHEWEWEDSPEVTLVVVDSVAEAIALFNAHSPRLVASLISDDATEQQAFYDQIDAPFVGNGFTRWVDGQFALLRPELGLSNWANGRLFSRSGVLSGDSVFTVRTRMFQTNPDLRR
jgi:glutamate-5-semialdehyde dehydrogenase